MSDSSSGPGEPRATILVVDDEPVLRDTVAYNLRREGFDVVLAADGLEALDVARAERPDLVVLDIMLPGMDGLDVCRALRVESTVPIIMLSAKGEEFDRVLGLEIGADDYLTKPFAMRELLARVRANLRRVKMPAEERASSAPGPIPTVGSTIVAGPLEIDAAKRRASLAGTPIQLKPKEFDVLYYFARHPGIVLTRDALLREVWGYDFSFDTRTVDVHIRWLRQKLEADPAAPRMIETVRGYGYRFNPAAQA